MHFLKTIICLALTFHLSLAHADSSQRYQQYTATAEGIGKVYMGREISHVMGYQGAAWLERESREKEERTDVLINTLNLQPGMVVADIGAGTGFLARQMAAKVGPAGKVFALDVQPEMVSKLNKLAKSYQNIQPMLSQARGVDLPKNSVDLAIMVDVYHELAFPYEVVQSLLPALKANGRLVLVEYRAEDDRVPIKATHKMSEAQVIKEMRAHALKWQHTHHDLPWQHVVVFSKSQ